LTNYYDVLGVSRDASEPVIRDRFRVLARESHPDRFTDPAKKAEAEARFQILTEAVNVLTNEARRKAHDFDLDKGKSAATFDPQAIAKVYLAKGAKAYREGDFLEALSNFQLSVQHWGKDAKALHYLALTCLKVQGQARKGVEAIEAAIRLEPQNGVFFRDAAKLYMQVGLKSKAERNAEEALKWIPGDPEAEKLLMELRPGSDPKKNIFGNLFGRRG
jgi:tetratricopeptide (TPR) repeat protein